MMNNTLFGRNTIIKLQPNDKIVIKTLNHPFPSKNDIQRFRNEYGILEGVELEGVRKVIDYQQESNTYQLRFEYVEGKTLSQYLESKSLSIIQLISLFVELSKVIGRIHQAGIIHKDLNPNNIIISPDEKIYLIDFGISSKFTLKQPKLGNPEKLEGTLSYISPEQTGRMNRSVDYRTDLYSLGVILYEALAQQLPFQMPNAMDLVYAHIAEKPLAPHEISPKVPKILSQITLTLLAKNPKKRYQSTTGLIFDLQKSKRYLAKNQKDILFKLRSNDFSGKLQIPEKLYGRDKEIKTILDAFQRVLAGSIELTVVAGYSGTGKSVLVNETHRPLTSTKGYFVEGKFDQFQRNIPFSAWIQIFENFIDLLLMESDRTLDYWRNLILGAVGNQGAVLTEMIPNLETVIGEQPPVPKVTGQEAQNRFNHVIQNFVRAITNENHPLILFIDDLQWADLASLDLLKTLVTDTENTHFLCVGAYRDNEVPPTHPLVSTLKEIQETTFNLNQIFIGNLDQKAVLEMLSETLQYPQDAKLETLNQAILSKTQGNAFFTHQFLKNLYEEELLHFSFEDKAWHWDNDRIIQADFTDNVVDFMIKKVGKLPKNTQVLLELAACIGSRFDLDTLKIIAEKDQVVSDLEKAILEGLIFPIDNNEYKFVHDRIQQAAYSLIDDENKNAVHLKVGQLLLEDTPEDELQDRIFDIVPHFNRGKYLLHKYEEIVQLAELNLLASDKAIGAIAYDSALNMLQGLLGIIPKQQFWETHFSLLFSIYNNKAICEYRLGVFEDSQRDYEVLQKKAQTPTQIGKIYGEAVYLHTTMNQYFRAIDLAREGLAMLGMDFPKQITMEILGGEFAKVNDSLAGRKIKDLVHLEEMKDPQKTAPFGILNMVIPPTWLAMPEGFAWSTLQMVDLSQKYGNNPFSSFGYAIHALLLSGQPAQYQSGLEYGELAIELNKKYPNVFVKGTIHFFFNCFVQHWKRHKKYNIPLHQVAHQGCSEGGAYVYGVYNVIFYFFQPFHSDISLSEVEEKFQDFLPFVEKINDQDVLGVLKLLLQLIKNFHQTTYHPLVLDDENFTDENYFAELQERNYGNGLCYYYFVKMMLYYTYESYDKALEMAEKLKPYYVYTYGLYHQALYHFYYALILAKVYPSEGIYKQNKIRQNLDEQLSILKNWAENCPENYLHKYQLVKAEIAQLEGGDWYDIFCLYEEAIRNAQKSEFKAQIAMANELLANHLSKEKPVMAQGYLLQAYQLYKQWGATAKVMHIEQSHPELFRQILPINPAVTHMTQTIVANSQDFDVETVLKATQSLSKKLDLEELLQEMLLLLTKNSGANKIVLLHNEEGIWYVEADQEEGKNLIDEPQLFGKYKNIPKQLISYVLRSQEAVLRDDISKDSTFEKDQYIQEKQSKSVLAVPIIRQSELVAVIYLENSLNTGVFHQRRYDLVNALATQLAISIDNTLLYQNMAQKVKIRTQELQNSNEELLVMNEELQQIQEEVTAQRDLLSLSNAELEEYKYRIGQSIKSAQMIQQAILPSAELFEVHFTEYFILNRPKDVVSGDFYWFDVVNDHKILIEADCTGHGVPGAFMTLIGYSIINQVIKVEKAITPDDIMMGIHRRIRRALRQKTTGNLMGMDLSILVIEQENEGYKIDFGGSGQKLYYIENKKVKKLKNSRRKVGGFSNRLRNKAPMKPLPSLVLPEGTVLYLSSDGFIDQNDVYRKRIGIEEFLRVLETIYSMPLAHQKAYLEDVLAQHQGKEEQRDDILVIGIRL